METFEKIEKFWKKNQPQISRIALIFFHQEKAQKTQRKIRHRLPKLTPQRDSKRHISQGKGEFFSHEGSKTRRKLDADFAGYTDSWATGSIRLGST